MWKTVYGRRRRGWERDDVFSVLCPTCDSLGPHPIDTQEMGWWDASVRCVDCLEVLGHLSWQGLIAFEDEVYEVLEE